MNSSDFLKKLAEQTAKPKDSVDKAIMKIINSWRKRETAAYTAFRQEPKTDVEYLANQFAKAGIDKNAAWEFVQKELGPCYDITSQDDIKEEFDLEFDSTPCDILWRNRVFKNIQ